VKSPNPKPSLPSKDDLLAFIGRQPGKIGTREIARAFHLKNADRIALKRLLRELADEGLVERRRKKLHHPGTLPQVVLAEIAERDADGELIAVPTEWDETKVLDARIADYVVVARRNGKDWYVGAMNDWTPRAVDIDLSFLPDGTFTMDAYQDGDNADRNASDYRKTTTSVNRTTKLKLQLASGGGLAARIHQ